MTDDRRREREEFASLLWWERNLNVPYYIDEDGDVVDAFLNDEEQYQFGKNLAESAFYRHKFEQYDRKIKNIEERNGDLTEKEKTELNNLRIKKSESELLKCCII